MRRQLTEHFWTLVADCRRCARPLRLVQPRTGGDRFWACTNRVGCGYTTSRDQAMEDLAEQLAEASNLLIRLLKAALPLLVQGVLNESHEVGPGSEGRTPSSPSGREDLEP